MVEIKCDTEPVMKKSTEYFEQFDVVILTGCVQEVMVKQSIEKIYCKTHRIELTEFSTRYFSFVETKNLKVNYFPINVLC
jgi:hypothetical protein